MPYNKITVSGSVVDNYYVHKVYKRAYSTAVKLQKVLILMLLLFIIIIIPI